jgi:hypothetical protein
MKLVKSVLSASILAAVAQTAVAVEIDPYASCALTSLAMPVMKNGLTHTVVLALSFLKKLIVLTSPIISKRNMTLPKKPTTTLVMVVFVKTI